VTIWRAHHRGIAALVGAALTLSAAITVTGQQGNPAPSGASAGLAREMENDQGAWVLIGGEPVVYVPTGVGSYSAELRAARIAERATAIVRDRTITDSTVTVVEAEDSSELRVGPRLLMVITPQDARVVGAARASLAARYASNFEGAIRAERLRYEPAALVRSSIAAAVATLIFVGFVWLLHHASRWLRDAIARWQARRALALRVQDAEIVSAERVNRGINRLMRALRVIVLLIALDLYLTYVLGLFPWTRAVSLTLLNYLVTPIETAAAALLAYLPNLVYVAVIVTVITLAIRLVSAVFDQIERGRLVFQSFPPEWANPTNKIVRLLLIAFGLVAAFPYLPASDSAAFAGVSVFMGILLSLSSSSAISNMVAGVVLTYTGAFRTGDMVRLGEHLGIIAETSLLATKIRTIKHEHVTIPNSIVLGSSITNYCRPGKTGGLILHTSVTIGYDAPWRKIHELLIAAARATPAVLETPPPFVWQTALNDFYVTYEINAYTDQPLMMPDTYAALHANIQEVFFAAGVEIMSPHFTAIRDGNTVAMPEAFRPAGYSAPPFRVDGGTPREAS
jgi:small-conductance mechanosensitive channel